MRKSEKVFLIPFVLTEVTLIISSLILPNGRAKAAFILIACLFVVFYLLKMRNFKDKTLLIYTHLLYETLLKLGGLMVAIDLVLYLMAFINNNEFVRPGLLEVFAFILGVVFVVFSIIQDKKNVKLYKKYGLKSPFFNS